MLLREVLIPELHCLMLRKKKKKKKHKKKRLRNMLLGECESVSFTASINLALRARSVVEQVDITYHTIGHLGHVSS